MISRNLILGLALVVAVSFACGERLEPTPPPRPVVVRQKISTAKQLPPKAVRPESPVAKKGPGAKVETKPVAMVKAPVKKPVQGPPVQVAVVAQPRAKPPLKKAKDELADGEKKPAVESPKSVPKMPEEKVVPMYDPRGKLDPFESIFVAKARMAEAKQQIKGKRAPRTPLERVALSQLKLVGIIASPTGNKALVEEPSGKGYVITRGTYVGMNSGQVKKILYDRVIVKELVEDFVTGKIKPQTTELKLQKKLGEE